MFLPWVLVLCSPVGRGLRDLTYVLGRVAASVRNDIQSNAASRSHNGILTFSPNGVPQLLRKFHIEVNDNVCVLGFFRAPLVCVIRGYHDLVDAFYFRGPLNEGPMHSVLSRLVSVDAKLYVVAVVWFVI